MLTLVDLIGAVLDVLGGLNKRRKLYVRSGEPSWGRIGLGNCRGLKWLVWLKFQQPGQNGEVVDV